MNPFPIILNIAPDKTSEWEILDSLGSFIAMVVAVATAIVTARLWWNARKANEERERSQHALRVHAWSTHFAVGGGPHQIKLGFGNFSDQPIFNVSFIVMFPDDPRQHVLGVWSMLPPGFVLNHDLPVGVAARRPSDAQIQLEFEDVNSRRWLRTPRAQPVEQHPAAGIDGQPQGEE